MQASLSWPDLVFEMVAFLQEHAYSAGNTIRDISALKHQHRSQILIDFKSLGSFASL